MLSIEKLTAGQESYYVRVVRDGEEDYYSERGEVPGRWVGTGSQLLGLTGEVDGDDFRSLLSGVAPVSGERLRRANGRVDGLDFTFSAPKSVSVLWALGSTEVTSAVVAADEHAVDEVLEYLEREAVRGRRGRNGVEVLEGDGLAVAAFRHRTSRAGDPQLHTHVVIANATRCGDDGVWRALDARHLYVHAQAAGYLYQSELRHGLSRRLGVEWGPVVKGCADLAVVPGEVLRGSADADARSKTPHGRRGTIRSGPGARDQPANDRKARARSNRVARTRRRDRHRLVATHSGSRRPGSVQTSPAQKQSGRYGRSEPFLRLRIVSVSR